MDRILGLHPAAPVSIPGIPKHFSEELFILDVAKVNRQHYCLEQWTAES